MAGDRIIAKECNAAKEFDATKTPQGTKAGIKKISGQAPQKRHSNTSVRPQKICAIIFCFLQ